VSTTAQEWKRRAENALRARANGEAIDAYRQYLQLQPDDGDAWFNLAFVLRGQRHFADSAAAYREALARDIVRPEEARLNLAVILSEHCGDELGAEAELQAAVAANPQFVPGWLNLGNLREDLGDPEGADEAYAAALEVDPACGRAHGRRAMIAMHQGDPDEAAARLEQVLREHRVVRAEDQAEVLFAFGHVLDAVGNYELAFAAIDRANRLRGQHLRYDSAAAERRIDTIIAGGSTRLAPIPADGIDPLFICGMFRSGSTLAEVLIARQFGLIAGGELEAVPALADQLGLTRGKQLAALDQGSLLAARNTYGAEARQSHRVSDGIIDKRCDNFLHIGLIKAMLPEARIIHTRRDWRDTLVSLYFGNFDNSMAYTFSLPGAAHWWRQYRRLMDHWEALYGADILSLDYELLATSPQTGLDQVGQFLGRQPAGPQQANAPARNRTVKTLSAWQVRQPVNDRSIGRWRNYRKYLAPVIDLGEAE
jgi:tetratricopeptide (TPR) repeat protein